LPCVILAFSGVGNRTRTRVGQASSLSSNSPAKPANSQLESHCSGGNRQIALLLQRVAGGGMEDRLEACPTSQFLA
jgi:hypothetical protein